MAENRIVKQPAGTQNPQLRAQTVDQLPRQLYIEVTNICNSLCASCPLTYDHFQPFEPKQHLSWESFRQIVDQVPQIERAVLHGIGEPLLNKELPRFVAHLKERGAQVLFNTNAILLDEQRGDALAAAGLDELRVSLDAVTPELYARLRGVNKLPAVIANLKAFVARHGARQPKVSLWFVGMQANLAQIPDFVRLGAEIGVPEVYLQRLVYFGDGQSIAEQSTMVLDQTLFGALESQQTDVITESEQLAASLGMSFHASGAATPLESIVFKGEHPWQGCMRPWSLMYITANGTALPCCVAPFAVADFRSIVLGNVLENPLAAVWNGERYRELRRAVLSEAPKPWPCQFCGAKWSL